MKIIKISPENVFIGTDDGQVLQIKKTDIDFEPKVGMEVEKYTSNDEIIITPKVVISEQENEKKNQEDFFKEAIGKGIVVNVDNSNSNRFEQAPTPVQESRKVVNKVTYVLLAIFLGTFGLHKFYAGKTGAGICYLIFCCTIVPTIISFFEGISACFQPADRRGNIIV